MALKRQGTTSGRVLLWMAWRNLVARKGRHGLSFMTVISIAGVTVGVSALIIVLSVMGGFEQELKRKMLKGQPHLEIMNPQALAGFPLKDYPLQLFRDQVPEATGIEAFTQADVVLKQGKHLSPVVLFGVDPKGEEHLWGFNDAMVEGKLADIGKEHLPILTTEGEASRWPGVVLGQTLATQLGADIGDEITILSPSAATSASTALGGGTITRHYVVVGTFATGLFNFDSKWAVVSLAEGRKFMTDYDPSMDADAYVSGVAINVKEPYNVSEFADRIKKVTKLDAKTWQDTNSALLFALKLEKFTMGSILMLIVLVAAFSISGTMMMTVFHKKRQVALLRSLGMSQRNIAKLFLAQGAAIGGVGIVFGVSFGLTVCFFLDEMRVKSMKMDLFYLKSLPVKYLPTDYLVICSVALILSLLGAVYPALTAARHNASQGLRY